MTLGKWKFRWPITRSAESRIPELLERYRQQQAALVAFLDDRPPESVFAEFRELHHPEIAEEKR